jgi:DNA-binding transcriptional LysR family regulator
VLVVCPAGHALTRVPAGELPQALAESPFVGYPADTPFYSCVKPAFERQGLPYRPDIDVDSPHHACALVKNGAGFAVVDEISFRASGPERMAILPILADQRLTVSLVHLRREPLAQFAQGFVDHLRRTLAESAFELLNVD